MSPPVPPLRPSPGASGLGRARTQGQWLKKQGLKRLGALGTADAVLHLWALCAFRYDTESGAVWLSHPTPVQYQRLHAWIAALPPNDCEVIEWRIVGERTLETVARVMGVTRERVRQIEARVLIKCRRFLST